MILSGSGKETFLISSMYFCYFCNNLPFEMGWVLHLNKLESPSPKVKSLQRQRRWTNCDRKSLLESLAQVS